jgi:anti-sigma B factor antagonist
MSSLTITKREVGGVVILDLVGSIHIGEGNIDLHRTLRSLIEQDERHVVLNLANVKSIDSSGLGELVAGYTTLEKNGGELKLLKLTERVKELMMITKLLTVFDSYEDETMAVESFHIELPRITQRLDEVTVPTVA